MSGDLTMAVVKLKRDETMEIVKTRVAKGEDPKQILEECRQGMTIIGDNFKKGDSFLVELILSAELFKGVMNIFNPYLVGERSTNLKGKIVLATLKGDIHDLGKNIVATLLRAQGLEVHDLGVDVDPILVVEKVKEVKPEFVGFSALITTAFHSMKRAATMLEEAGLRKQFKLMVGGGVTTPMVKDYISADFQTLDAMEGVRYCMDQLGNRRN